MNKVFDPRPIMEERELLDPIHVEDPAEFPHDPTVPEGCTVLYDLTDDFPMVDYRSAVYASRDGRDLEVKVLVPTLEDPVMMKEPPKMPLVAFIQGSAFHEQFIHCHLTFLMRLAERGFVVALIQYRPSEVAPFPAQTQDAKTAIRYLRKHADEFCIDPERVAVFGDSSGGHTSLMVAFTGDDELDTDLYNEYSCSVKACIDWYGPTCFPLMNYYPSSQNHYDADSPEGFEIGRKNVLENLDEADKTIPMNYLSEDKPTPPTLIMNGGRDWLVPFNQSVILYETMKKMGKDVVYYKIDQASHGILGFNNNITLQIVSDFLRRYV